MSSWFRMEASFRDHPKVKKLARRLECSLAEARGFVAGLWCWICDASPDGNLSSYDAEDLAIAADWSGDPEVFRAALVATGLIDETPDGAHLHDWMERAKAYVEAQRSADRRKAKRDRRPTAVEPRTDLATDRQTDTEDTHLLHTPSSARAREGSDHPEFDELLTQWHDAELIDGMRMPDRHLTKWTSFRRHLEREFPDVPMSELSAAFVENALKSEFARKFSLLHYLRKPDQAAEVIDGAWVDHRATDPPPTPRQQRIDRLAELAFEAREREQHDGDADLRVDGDRRPAVAEHAPGRKDGPVVGQIEATAQSAPRGRRGRDP